MEGEAEGAGGSASYICKHACFANTPSCGGQRGARVGVCGSTVAGEKNEHAQGSFLSRLQIVRHTQEPPTAHWKFHVRYLALLLLPLPARLGECL